MKQEEIISYLGIKIENTYSIKITQHKKVIWQKNLFEKIYKTESNIDIFEILGLQFLNWARLSLVLLLDYVLNHQPRLLEHLRMPNIFTSNKYLYLGNRALEQLNIITKSSNEPSLLNIINYTKTSIGKRYLNSQLVMPLIDSKLLNQRYDAIKKILDNDHQNKLSDYLEDIYDLDKIIRKLEINIINPYELYQLYLSFYQINKLINYFQDNNLMNVFDIDNDIINSTSGGFLVKICALQKASGF